MQPSELWPSSTVFVETGMRNGQLGASLLRAGLSNYLGVSSDRERVAKIQSQHPELARHVTHAPWRRCVEMNNAQVVVLSGFTVLYLWRYRALRHAESIAWSANLNIFTCLGMLGWLISALLLRRFSRPVRVTCQMADGRSRQLFVSRVLRRKPHHLPARHYIPHSLGLSGVFKAFEQLGVPYAVLRWYEGLPERREGRDIDLLVADEKLEAVRTLLNSQPGIELADVYTPSGLPKSDYFGTPYYPAENARRVLTRTRWHNGYCRIPEALDHFHMLVYHAIYHNGPRSGLASRDHAIQPDAKPAHDYQFILRDLAQKLNIDVELTLEGLHEYLSMVDWAPRPDMLARMAAHYTRNPWLKTLSGKLGLEVNDRSLTVFCIRQKAVELGFGDQIIAMLERGGWKIVMTKKLTAEESQHAAIHLRGGTWDKGVFKTSGGPPSIIVVVYDSQPINPTRAQRRKDPNIVNARQLIKYEVRKTINARVPRDEEFSAIHSTDFGGEAWYCLELCMPERVEEIKAAVAQLRESSLPSRRAA
jgi:hypothetical protein